MSSVDTLVVGDILTRYEKASKLKAEDFKQLIGIKGETFDDMVEVLTDAYNRKHKRRGRHAVLSRQDQLFLALKYWRQYVTQKELAYEFAVSETTAKDTIMWVEDTLVKCGKFSLPGKKALLGENEIEVILVDATESPIERPQKTKAVVLRQKEETHHQNPINCKQGKRANHLYSPRLRQNS
jgi:hypothetical protein